MANRLCKILSNKLFLTTPSHSVIARALSHYTLPLSETNVEIKVHNSLVNRSRYQEDPTEVIELSVLVYDGESPL